MKVNRVPTVVWLALIGSLFFSSLFFSTLSLAQENQGLSIYDLQASQDVEISAWVGDRSNPTSSATFSVNQQVILNIEVATPRWFTGGTRIGSVEIPNVIAKQRNQLATNYTERKDGKTWSRQRWEVTLYPQESGEFVVPPIAVRVQVSAPDGSNVSGTLYTEPVRFAAQLPSGLLSDKANWFAATNVTVEQQWLTSNDDLQVGDSVTRAITIQAQDSLSILLPDLLQAPVEPSVEDKQNSEGQPSTRLYQVYPMPNRLTDSQSRGDYQSSREEQSVYVLQQGGEIAFPELTFQWWNIQKNRLETVTIEGRRFEVQHTVKSFVTMYAKGLSIAATLLLLIVLSVYAIKRYFKHRAKPAWLVLHQLIKQREWGKIRLFIYRQLRMTNGDLELAKFKPDDQWRESSQRFLAGEQDSHLTRKLWRTISNKRKTNQSKRGFRGSIPPALPELERLLNTISNTNKAEK
ncbi:hypothetical protein EGH82_11345 [Vibrio ponticus]|uniref:Protein BatD n=1 Tax=Vibrio ponticus TaxID=265668 RepID=A0A3N3DZV1_9VIBR|nr:BatD family protein [Vibrio ponticus]ROV59942.1 hypothetical protein EGH82_11345 [Vibrio ponticus]